LKFGVKAAGFIQIHVKPVVNFMVKDKQISANETAGERADICFSRPDKNKLLVQLAGSWKIGTNLPSSDEVNRKYSVQKIGPTLAFQSDRIWE